MKNWIKMIAIVCDDFLACEILIEKITYYKCHCLYLLNIFFKKTSILIDMNNNQIMRMSSSNEMT